jgi:hypothetical protein
MIARLFRVVLFILATFGLIAFLAIAVGSWYAKAAAERELAIVEARVSLLLDRGTAVAGVVEDVAKNAQADLRRARSDPAAQDPNAVNGIQGFVLRTALSGMPDKVRQALVAANVASEAMIVAHAALDTTADLPGGPAFDPAEIDRLQTRLNAASKSLQSADAMLRSADPTIAKSIKPDDVQFIDNALTEGLAVAKDVQERLGVFRGRLVETGERVRLYLKWATWAVCALAVLAAIGQISLMGSTLRCRRTTSEA